jgi:hypothetical protein
LLSHSARLGNVRTETLRAYTEEEFRKLVAAGDSPETSVQRGVL